MLPNSWNKFLDQKTISSNQKNTMGVFHQPSPIPGILDPHLRPSANPAPRFWTRANSMFDGLHLKFSSIKLKLSTLSTWQQTLLKICENLWKRLEINPNIWYWICHALYLGCVLDCCLKKKLVNDVNDVCHQKPLQQQQLLVSTCCGRLAASCPN